MTSNYKVLKVDSREQAWAEADKIFPAGYKKDEPASARAGYDVYRNPDNYYNTICDLWDRLEVTTDESVTNIWIEPETATPAPAPAEEPAYGMTLAEKIRAEKPGLANITAFEKFAIDRGFEFDTKEEFQAAYDRHWKCSRDILITEDEFFAEATVRLCIDRDVAQKAYETLAKFAKEKKIGNSDVYQYARHRWCLASPEAITAHEVGRGKWVVNNCNDKITEDEAIVLVNSEWGFEASRITLVGTAYYAATDWQHIRFDCRNVRWLWSNGELYQVYD